MGGREKEVEARNVKEGGEGRKTGHGFSVQKKKKVSPLHRKEKREKEAQPSQRRRKLEGHLAERKRATSRPRKEGGRKGGVNPGVRGRRELPVRGKGGVLLKTVSVPKGPGTSFNPPEKKKKEKHGPRNPE